MQAKQCSICGKEKALVEFNYGNRSGRSYCKDCNAEDQSIYRKKGLAAVQTWRAKMRQGWKKAY
jgi:hypothetical protein